LNALANVVQVLLSSDLEQPVQSDVQNRRVGLSYFLLDVSGQRLEVRFFVFLQFILRLEHPALNNFFNGLVAFLDYFNHDFCQRLNLLDLR